MENEDGKNTLLTAPTQNVKEKTEGDKKYNFYRKPSIKKKAPEVKQTLTSYKRMLNANPLLKYEMEGKDLSLITKQLHSSLNNQNKTNNALGKLPSEKQSLQPKFNSRKLLTSNTGRSNSLKNPSKTEPRALKNGANTILSGNKPKSNTNAGNSIDMSRQSNVDFNTSASRFLCSTKLENTSCKVQKKATSKLSNNSKSTNKTSLLTQDNSVPSSRNSKNHSRMNKENKVKPLRRSLSAQHFDRKKGILKPEPQKFFSRVDLTQSLDDVSSLKPTIALHDISPIAEGSRESSMNFKTPSAYDRRSITQFTPRSTIRSRRSLYHPTTPLPSLNDLQKRLNDWLTRRGKNPSSFYHLKHFAHQDSQESDPIDEENKENIEVFQDLDKGSYEDLKIDNMVTNGQDRKSNEKTSIVLTEENVEIVSKAALEDLHKLIQMDYPRPQCEGWLELIRQKYRKLEEEPQYWECRAAIEQSRGNISNAVHCYKTAIVQGAKIQAVDVSLDILLQKFSLLNISTDKVESEKSVRERARIVQDARNVFKSSIIQFAIQERRLKNNREGEQRKLVATPVRRSTRLSRTAYTSTPGVKICSSLQELEYSHRGMIDFEKNKALF